MKGHILYGFSCEKCPGWANILRQKADVASRGWGRDERGGMLNGYWVSFWGDEYALEPSSDNGCTTL